MRPYSIAEMVDCVWRADTVAMESTDVYGIALFELLDSGGFAVYSFNARHVKNVSGRNSDSGQIGSGYNSGNELWPAIGRISSAR